MRRTDAGQFVQTPQEIADRLGVSVEFGHEHQSAHRCLDGRRYLASCLVADPTCDAIARHYLHPNQPTDRPAGDA